MEYKRNNNSEGTFHPLPIDLLHGVVNRTKKMAEIKFGLILAYLIGIPGGVLAFIATFNTWQSNTIFTIMSVYWIGLLVFQFRRKIRIEARERTEQKLRDIEAWHKEMDRLERDEKRKQNLGK